MAIIFMDSFDHYGSADFLKKWSGGGGTLYASGYGRRGGGSIFRPLCHKNFDATKTTVIAGFAVSPTGGGRIMYFGYGDTVLTALHANTAGELLVYNDLGAIIGRTRPNLMATSAYAYVEIKAVMGTTAGAVEVRVNGKVELSLTNVRTSASQYTSIGFGQLINWDFLIDDLYVCDTSGSVNNDFLGDCRVDAYMPTSEGALLEWTPTPAGVHYTTVDDNPINTADYIETATAGAIDLFGYTDLVNVPLAVFGVQLNSAIRKTDAGEREFNGVARIGSTNYLGPNMSLYDSTIYIPTIWDVNPSTGTAWTREQIDAAQFGVKLV